jgi:hypothetical protein
VALLVIFVVVGASGLLGPKTGTTSASAGGYTLDVTYPAVTRPGLPVRWEYQLRHPGGFEGPITLSFTFDYIHLFDLTNIEPEASSAVATGDRLVYGFDPPDGDTFRVSMDAAAESGFHETPTTLTTVSVRGREVVSVSFSTRVVP